LTPTTGATLGAWPFQFLFFGRPEAPNKPQV
jgi:hypothetical protein